MIYGSHVEGAYVQNSRAQGLDTISIETGNIRPGVKEYNSPAISMRDLGRSYGVHPRHLVKGVLTLGHVGADTYIRCVHGFLKKGRFSTSISANLAGERSMKHGAQPASTYLVTGL